MSAQRSPETGGLMLPGYAGFVPTNTESIRQRAAAARRWVVAGADPTPSGEPFLDLSTREMFDHDIPALLAAYERVVAERDEALVELVKLKGARLLSVLFGHHDGAPRAFALQRKDTGHTLVALGAEFPDDAVALRLANDGGWTTKSEGGAAQFATDDVEILWLTDELDSLADTEQRAERAETEIARLRSDLDVARARGERWRRLAVDLTRCEHGRVQGDTCSGCPDRTAPSQAGRPIGHSLDGTYRVVVPERATQADPDAWYVLARAVDRQVEPTPPSCGYRDRDLATNRPIVCILPAGHPPVAHGFDFAPEETADV